MFRGAPVALPWVLAHLAPLLLGAPLAAQVTSPDALALGLGGPSPSLARGFAAISANPAALGSADSPSWSVSGLAFEIRRGLDPVTLGDLANWDGRDIPRTVRAAWLDDVRRSGSESGGAGLDLTLVSLSLGRLGFQLSARAAGDVSLNPDAVELLLFGNAGLTGEPRDYELAGSAGDGFVVTTGSLAYGLPVAVVDGGSLHLGATASISLGHALWVARDNGSGLTGDPTRLDLRFPILHVDGNVGSGGEGLGFAVDLGALWTRGPLSLGATVHNALNTFSWDLDDLVLRPGSAFFDPGRSTTDFDERPGSEAPPVMLDALEDMTFPLVLAAGAAYRLRPKLTVTGDMVFGPGGGMAVDSDLRVGIGAEYTPRPDVPLTGGVAILERGVQLSAGVGLKTGRLSVSSAAAVRTGSLDDAILGSLGVAFHPR